MPRIFALAAVLTLAAAVAAQDKGWTDKTVKLTIDAKLGTKQAGGLLRDGAALRRGQAFTVKSDDGTFIELAGETGHILKGEAQLFAAREMPKKGDAKPKADAKDLWPAGTKVLPKRLSRGIQFGDRDADGRAIFYDLTGLGLVIVRDNGDGWVRVRDRSHEGWVGKDDLVPNADAAAHFDKAVKANPRDAWAWFMLAASYHATGEHDRAIEAYTEYIGLNASDRAAFNNRGNVWLSKKEYDKAIADYDDAIKLDPEFTLAYSNRANARVGKKQYEKAIADADKALELDPRFASAVVYKARALAGLKKYAAAVKGFEAAVELDPTAPRLNSYAWFLATCPDAKGRDGKKAVELATKVVAQVGAGGNWVYRDTLAAAHAEAGDFDLAVTEQKKALEDKAIVAAERKKMEERLELYRAKKPYRDDE